MSDRARALQVLFARLDGDEHENVVGRGLI